MQARNIDESDLFIAKSINSLSDFLETDISNNKRVHCTFDKAIYDKDPYLVAKCKKRGIVKITFLRDGTTGVKK